MDTRHRPALPPAALLALFLGAPLAAHEHSPRVLSPHRADTYSLLTFSAYERWRGLEGDARVLEVLRYLTDRRSGIYPLGVPAREGPDDLIELCAVNDPVKLLNVYPVGHCGTLGPAAAALLEGMGIGPARTLILPGWGHVAAEVFYGGGWHYVDLDVRAVFLRPDGSLASLEDARREPDLWKGPSGPLFFPLDPLPEVERAYAATRVDHRYGVAAGGHTMDYVLRRGESLRRWWRPQGGRWNHHPSYNERPFPRSLFEQEPRGPKCKHRSFTVHTHGNGRFLYRPDLRAGSLDFEDGVREARNVRPGPEGLTLAAPGEGFAVFEVRSPYVIVPLVGDLDTTADDREASVVEVEAEGASLLASLDGGRSWLDLEAASPPSAESTARRVLDLTPHVSGRYGYLLKLLLRGKGEAGKPETAVVRSLSITTWVQVHPASLPALGPGLNRMRYVTGDHHGLPTHVLELKTAGRGGEDLRRLLAEPPEDLDPSRATRRAAGSLTVRLEAPEGQRIAWFTAGGSFTAHQGAEAPRTAGSIAWAIAGAAGKPEGFREVFRSALPAGHAHWHTSADVEVRLEEPAPAVHVRYHGDPGLNHVRLRAHCLPEKPCPRAPVMITHGWREKGAPRQAVARLDGPGTYEVDAGEDPEDEFVEIAVPSSAVPLSAVPSNAVPSNEGRPEEPGWVEAMREVHRRFRGKRGTLACFGDSITVSMAFWASLRGGGRNLSPEALEDYRLVERFMLPECWSGWKGPEHGNDGGKTMRWARENVERWLEKLAPEAAVILFGTNDLGSFEVEEYERETRRVVERCLARGTVVILTTPPPRSGQLEKCRRFAAAVRRVAADLKVPLCDYFEECLRRRPDDWDGAASRWEGHDTYEVPTLISRDGVHPSNPRRHAGDYSEEGLRSSGYVLRSYLTLRSYAEVIGRVLEPREALKR